MTWWCLNPGLHFNIKALWYKYKIFHYKYKIVSQRFDFDNGNPVLFKMIFAFSTKSKECVYGKWKYEVLQVNLKAD